VIQSAIQAGRRSHVDPRYRENPIEAKLLEIVELCWIHDPKERVDIFTVVAMLRNLSSSIAETQG
jgi:hypothetical protein